MLYKKIKTYFSICINKIKNKYRCFCYYKDIKKSIKVNKEKKDNVFLFDIPEHGNLGDHAIAIAEKKFLYSYFPDIVIHEIPQKISKNCCLKLRPLIQNSTIIITGGGNMGTLWFHHEELFRELIKYYPKNRIVFFPQTIYYADSEWGRQEFEISKNIYNAHSDLHICAREKTSYKIMKNAYENNEVVLVPDIVTYLKKDMPDYKRNGILLCIRSDKESVLNKQTKDKIYKLASKFSQIINVTSTVVPMIINIDVREHYLEEKLNEFKKSRLVITDRLHGMIFSAITSTPCVAIDNYSHKVKGTYEWIKNNDYIQLVEDIDEIPKFIEILFNMRDCSYDNRNLEAYFNKIAELMQV